MTADRELVTDLLEAMVSRDRAKLSQVLAGDAVWHTPPSCMPAYKGPHRGLNAILDLVGGAGGDLFVLGTQRIKIEFIVTDGEMAAVQFRQIAKTMTGRDYDNLYSFFLRYKSGKIVEVWENLDTGYFYAVFDINPEWVSKN